MKMNIRPATLRDLIEKLEKLEAVNGPIVTILLQNTP